jgi:hypothetical protein
MHKLRGKQGHSMIARRLGGCALALVLAVMVEGLASPSAFAAPPGPGDPGYCGAHTSPLECWTNTGPATTGENAFIDQILSYRIAGVPTDRTRLLQIARGTCTMLSGGTSPNYIVKELAEDLGKPEGVAGQIYIVAQDNAC